jgi:hypothetical protein
MFVVFVLYVVRNPLLIMYRTWLWCAMDGISDCMCVCVCVCVDILFFHNCIRRQKTNKDGDYKNKAQSA